MTQIEDFAKRRTFHTLDGLRGVAALGVVSIHYSDILHPIILPSAYLAVDLFFVMSGIVIAHAYETRLRTSLSVAGFMAARWIRLLPLYLVGLGIGLALVFAALVLGKSNWTFGSFLIMAFFNILLLPSPVGAQNNYLYPLDAPAWSLFWELVINFAYALALPILGRRSLTWAIGLSAIALLATAYSLDGLDHGFTWDFAYVGLVRVTFSFLVGLFIARLFEEGRLPRLRVPPILLLIAPIPLFALPAHIGWLKDVLAILFFFPLLCAAAIQNDPRKVRIYTFFGVISYPIYTIHAAIPWTRLIAMVSAREANDLAPWIGLIIVAFVVLVAWALARWYDPPARRLLSYLIRDRRPQNDAKLS